MLNSSNVCRLLLNVNVRYRKNIENPISKNFFSNFRFYRRNIDIMWIVFKIWILRSKFSNSFQHNLVLLQTLYSFLRYYTVFLDNIQFYQTLYSSIRHYTVLSDIIQTQLSKTSYSSIRHYIKAQFSKTLYSSVAH